MLIDLLNPKHRFQCYPFHSAYWFCPKCLSPHCGFVSLFFMPFQGFVPCYVKVLFDLKDSFPNSFCNLFYLESCLLSSLIAQIHFITLLWCNCAGVSHILETGLWARKHPHFSADQKLDLSVVLILPKIKFHQNFKV